MKLVKRLSRGLALGIFAITVPLLIFFTAGAITFGTPDTLKQALRESSIYERAVDSTFTSLERENAEEGTVSEVPLNDQAVRHAAEQAFPPETLERSAEEIIDGTYHWLNGEVAQPDFRVDLSDAKQTLATSIANQAVERLERLPVCTTGQLSQINLSDINPFDLPCVPPGLDIQAERTRYFDEIVNSDEFLGDPVITADTLRSDNGDNPFEDAKNVPHAFQWIVRLPWLLGALALLAGGLAVWLYDDRRQALTKLVRVVLTSGLIFLVASITARFLLGNVSLEETVELQDLLVAVFIRLAALFNQTLIIVSAAASVIGAAGLLVLYRTRPHIAKPAGPSRDSDEKIEIPAGEPSQPPTSASDNRATSERK